MTSSASAGRRATIRSISPTGSRSRPCSPHWVRSAAIVSAAGEARFGELDTLTDADFAFSLSNKLMGQVNLVRFGHPFVIDGGSITLTSGVLAHHPIVGSAAISLVNAGIEGFVRAAALELPRGIRINVVSPPWVTETLQAMGMATTHGLPSERVALAYKASVEGDATGEVHRSALGDPVTTEIAAAARPAVSRLSALDQRGLAGSMIS